MTAGFETGESWFDEEGGNSLPAGRWIGFCKDDEDAGDAAVGDPGFCALEFVDGVVADSSSLDCGRVGAGLGFGEAEGAENFSGGEALEIFFLLCFGAEIEEGIWTAELVTLRAVAMAASMRATSSSMRT